MADANDGRVTLWRAPNGTLHAFPVEGGVEGVWRPRADDDARPMVTGGGLIKFDRRADDAPRESAPASGEVFVYRPASWKGQAPDDAKGRDDVKWVCRRADDASGAEAMREAWAYAVVNAQGKRTGVIHADRSRLVPIVEADNDDDLAGGPFSIVPLAPLPAPDDAVEEARNAVLDAVATWRAAEKRIAAAYLRGQIDTATFTKRNDEAAAGELTEIRLASDALDAALRREKGGGEAPTPADPTKPAPKATSADASTTEK